MLFRSLDEGTFFRVAWSAAPALFFTGEEHEALAAFSAILLVAIRRSSWTDVRRSLSNISVVLVSQNRLAKGERCLVLALDLANLIDEKEHLFRTRLTLFGQLAMTGRWADAEAMWQLLGPMGRDWPRTTYRPGDAEEEYARFRFWKEDLKEENLAHAEQLAKGGKSRIIIRSTYGLRGRWQ